MSEFMTKAEYLAGVAALNEKILRDIRPRMEEMHARIISGEADADDYRIWTEFRKMELLRGLPESASPHLEKEI